MNKVWIYKREGRPGWWVGWYEKGRRKSKVLPTKALAEHFQHIKYTQLNQDVFIGCIRVPWDDLVELYKSHKTAKGLEPSSLYQSLHTLDLFAEKVKKVASTEFTINVVEQFIQIRLKEVKPYTVAKDIAYLRAFVNWAAEQNFMSPFKIERIKTPEPPVVLVESEVIQKTLQSLKNEPTYFVRLILALSTGLRRGDIDSLKVSDVNLKECYVHSSSQKTRKVMPRRPIPEAVVPTLEQYIKELPKEQIELFVDTFRRKKWLRLLKRAKVKEFTFQQIRKTFASTLTHKGASKAAVQQLTEHSDQRVLDKHYLNVDSMLAKTVNLLPMDEWLQP